MDTICLPLKKCKGDESWTIIPEKIGEKSKYGSIYQICCEKNCDYILKFQYDKLKTSHEIEIHKHIYNTAPKLVPKIIDEYECKLGSGIILEKLDLTLGKVLQIINQEEDELKKFKIKLKIQKELREMVSFLHNYCGIIHNDLHVNNIMCRINTDKDEEDDDEDMFINWKIIDFGESKYIKSYTDNTDLVYKANEDYYHINDIL
jgi:tRNA A-37 threonylcarbamoyl transferase component Bud32